MSISQNNGSTQADPVQTIDVPLEPPQQPVIAPKRYKTRRRRSGKKGGRVDGRKNKDLVQRIVDAILSGNTYKNACTLAGISDRTLCYWLSDNDDKEYKVRFFRLVKEAEARAIHRNVLAINTAAKKNWQAAAWFLERRRPEDYGRTDRLIQQGNIDGGPVKVEMEIGNKFASLVDKVYQQSVQAPALAHVIENGNGSNGE
jgi:hypothetical protein